MTIGSSRVDQQQGHDGSADQVGSDPAEIAAKAGHDQILAAPRQRVQ
jgi:hypothetical protein